MKLITKTANLDVHFMIFLSLRGTFPDKFYQKNLMGPFLSTPSFEIIDL